MTNEELRQKYRLLKVVAEHGVRSYQALDARGHIVMLHHLSSDAPETQRLLRLLDALSPADKRRIVERLTVDGTPVLVTELIQNFETFPGWLEAAAQRARTAPTPRSPTHRPGELTQLFGSESGDKPPAAPEQARPSESLPIPSRSSERAPGEFTRVFGPASGPPSTPPSPPSNAAPTAADRSPEPPPGKKPTVRWREPSSDADRAERAADQPMVRWKRDAAPEQARDPRLDPRRKPPGELTGLFGAAGGAPADSTAPPVNPLLEPPPAPFSDPGSAQPGATPGEFTRLFQLDKKLGVPNANAPGPGAKDYLHALNSPSTPPGNAPASGSPSDPTRLPPTGQQPGEFTKLMSGVATPHPVQGESVGRPAVASGTPGGPGDFTRIVGRSPPAPASAPPPPAGEDSEAAAPRRSHRLLLLVVALGVVFVVAVALVGFLALRGPS